MLELLFLLFLLFSRAKFLKVILCQIFKFVDSWKNFSRIDKLEILLAEIFLNPIQDGFFGGRSRMGGVAKKSPPCLKSVTHILQWWNLAKLYLT